MYTGQKMTMAPVNIPSQVPLEILLLLFGLCRPIEQYMLLFSAPELIHRLSSKHLMTREANGDTLLHILAKDQGPSRQLARALFSRKDLDVNVQNNNWKIPLVCAAQYGNHWLVKLLLERGDFNSYMLDYFYFTPLVWAAKKQDEGLVKILLANRNVRPNEVDIFRRTALSYAAEYRNEAIVRLLLADEDVDAEWSDETARSPLSYAAEAGSKRIVELLLDREEVNAHSVDSFMKTPFVWAAEYGHLEIMMRLEESLTTVCADGGANHFYEMMKARGREDVDHPTTIIGDLDSIHPHIKAHYQSHGVNVIYHHDDYSTDFTKALRYIRANTSEILSSSATASSTPDHDQANNTHQQYNQDGSLSILILGGLGGRVDQAFSQIHHLYSNSTIPSSPPSTSSSTEEGGKRGEGALYLVSEESITFILHPGKNVIRTPGVKRGDIPSSSSYVSNSDGIKEREEGYYLLEENVGIIPLSGMERITTKGFQWDVESWETEIGGQISTSNHIRAEEVEVTAGGAVLFTVELAGRFKRISS
ncbi:thiamine pyrophosphokinase 1 [Aspergillus awamori]|uniref:Thiamine pyrophosphokinase 1 n=1 Tax=Aspergillus awamori TaxID=105351 RepID=A0A401KDN0_ASPAW|nr:thiamine pyrophosphokinase 1 [Aspergillus awamori]